MTPEAAEQVSQLDSVAWVGVFHPAYKMDPALLRGGGAARLYRVRIERGANVDATVDAIAGAGAQVVGRGGRPLRERGVRDPYRFELDGLH